MTNDLDASRKALAILFTRVIHFSTVIIAKNMRNGSTIRYLARSDATVFVNVRSDDRIRVFNVIELAQKFETSQIDNESIAVIFPIYNY